MSSKLLLLSMGALGCTQAQPPVVSHNDELVEVSVSGSKEVDPWTTDWDEFPQYAWWNNDGCNSRTLTTEENDFVPPNRLELVEVPVIEDDGQFVRILSQTEKFRLAHWVRRRDLPDVVVQEVGLASEGHLLAHPGAFVKRSNGNEFTVESAGLSIRTQGIAGVVGKVFPGPLRSWGLMTLSRSDNSVSAVHRGPSIGVTSGKIGQHQSNAGKLRVTGGYITGTIWVTPISSIGNGGWGSVCGIGTSNRRVTIAPGTSLYYKGEKVAVALASLTCYGVPSNFGCSGIGRGLSLGDEEEAILGPLEIDQLRASYQEVVDSRHAPEKNP